jgi:hypothetical protein
MPGLYRFPKANFLKFQLMRRTQVFLLRLMLGVWIVLICAFIGLLLPNAPGVSNPPFASVSLAREGLPNGQSKVHLPNRIFSCTEMTQRFQCQTELVPAQQLALSWTKGQEYRYNLTNCQAWYNGQPIPCRETGQTYAHILADEYEVTIAALSSQQLQSIQQTHWGIGLIKGLGELRLMWIVSGLSIIAGVSMGYFAWLYPNFFAKVFASLVCGIGVGQALRAWLGSVPYDALSSYGRLPDAWIGVMNGAAIATGIMTTIAVARLLWQNVNRTTRVLVGLLSGLGMFYLCWLPLMWHSIFWGAGWSVTDQFPQMALILGVLPGLLSVLFSTLTAILLVKSSHSAQQTFLSLSNGFGAMAFTAMLLFSTLAELGYLD